MCNSFLNTHNVDAQGISRNGAHGVVVVHKETSGIRTHTMPLGFGNTDHTYSRCQALAKVLIYKEMT